MAAGPIASRLCHSASKSICSKNLSSPRLSKNAPTSLAKLVHEKSAEKHAGMMQVPIVRNLIPLIGLTHYSDFENKDHNPSFQLHLTK